MTTTVLKEIGAFLLGRRYWANIVVQRWASDTQTGQGPALSNFIFPTPEAAARHAETLKDNRSFEYVETVSFRSRRDYRMLTDKPTADER